MDEYNKHGKVELAGLRAGMGRKTASKYIHEGKLPSDLVQPRSWRTRPDPFEEAWQQIAERLTDAPELEAKILFEDLMEREPALPGVSRWISLAERRWVSLSERHSFVDDPRPASP